LAFSFLAFSSFNFSSFSFFAFSASSFFLLSSLFTFFVSADLKVFLLFLVVRVFERLTFSFPLSLIPIFVLPFGVLTFLPAGFLLAPPLEGAFLLACSAIFFIFSTIYNMIYFNYLSLTFI
jgi:hypothetical protein